MTVDPGASRPYMPGYGIADDDEGLLPWSWADAQLERSHDYWVATIRADGRPAVTPVWGVWRGKSLWFSCSPASAKARNLARDPRCTATTDDAHKPVVIEGTAARIEGHVGVVELADRLNAKYSTDYGVGFFMGTACFELQPQWVFALDDDNFSGSPTRWLL
jgi:PPOX class probable F420-dependent enzyme